MSLFWSYEVDSSLDAYVGDRTVLVYFLIHNVFLNSTRTRRRCWFGEVLVEPFTLRDGVRVSVRGKTNQKALWLYSPFLAHRFCVHSCKTDDQVEL